MQCTTAREARAVARSLNREAYDGASTYYVSVKTETAWGVVSRRATGYNGPMPFL